MEIHLHQSYFLCCIPVVYTRRASLAFDTPWTACREPDNATKSSVAIAVGTRATPFSHSRGSLTALQHLHPTLVTWETFPLHLLRISRTFTTPSSASPSIDPRLRVDLFLFRSRDRVEHERLFRDEHGTRCNACNRMHTGDTFEGENTLAKKKKKKRKRHAVTPFPRRVIFLRPRISRATLVVITGARTWKEGGGGGKEEGRARREGDRR